MHQAFQALTRLGPPSIPLVCLHRTELGLTLEPGGSGPVVDLVLEPGPELTRQLAQHAVRVTHRAIVNHFLAQPVPDGWRKHPLLRNYRLAVFTNNICSLTDSPHTLRLSRELGLEIQKEVQ